MKTMKRTVKDFSAPSAKGLGGAARRAAMMLLTTTTAWALTPKNNNHIWDAETKTLTLNSSVNGGSSTYQDETEIEHLVINPGVEWLDAYSFDGCSNLQDVTYAEGVNLWMINDYAFSECTSLTTITIPASVTSVGRNAFKDTGWYNSQADGPLYLDKWLLGYKGDMHADYELSIADGTKGIAAYAFYDCGTLSAVNISASVTSIENGAFYGCSNLATVNFADISALPTIGEGAFEETACVDESGMLYFGNIAYKYYGDATDVTIADGTVLIYDKCFYDNETLESVTIPASVTTIGEEAFYYCEALESVTFASGSKLEVIGDYAFEYCEALTTITIPASVTTIGEEAFYYCEALESVTFEPGSKLEVISDDAFEYCEALTSITIPASVTSIGDDAFNYCTRLQAINVEEDNENYTSEDGVLFNKTKTTLVQYPAGKSRAPYIVLACVTTIGYGAFDSCEKLESVTFEPGSKLEVIGNYAFEYCEALKTITIPASVTYIGYDAFDGCSRTTDVYCYADPDELTWESYDTLTVSKRV